MFFFKINIAQSKWVFYSTQTHRAGTGGGQFFYSVQIHTWEDFPELIYALADFLQQLLCGFWRLKFGGFIVFSF